MVSILHFFHDYLPFFPDGTTDMEFQCRKVPVDQQPFLTLPASRPAMLSMPFLHRETQARISSGEAAGDQGVQAETLN